LASRSAAEEQRHQPCRAQDHTEHDTIDHASALVLTSLLVRNVVVSTPRRE
jgi:hypothetical protein